MSNFKFCFLQTSNINKENEIKIKVFTVISKAVVEEIAFYVMDLRNLFIIIILECIKSKLN